MVDVNGIKIGMVCYTWAYSSNGTSFSLNGLTPIKDEGQMNYFLNNDPGKLYTASEQILEQMGYMENRIKVNFSEGESVRIISGI